MRAAGNHRYVWTTGSWLLYEYLDQASPEARKAMEAAIMEAEKAAERARWLAENEPRWESLSPADDSGEISPMSSRERPGAMAATVLPRNRTQSASGQSWQMKRK